MSVVILTRRGIEHRYVTRQLADAFGDQIDAVILDDPPRRSLPDQLRRLRKRYTTAQLGIRATTALHRTATRAGQRREATMSGVLFPDGEPDGQILPERTHVVPSHNGTATLDLLDRLVPAVIAVYGTLIIQPPVIRMARTAILNMHTGISPRYRGADTYFWPLYNEEPEWVGTTIHRVDEGIDSGPIIDVVRPEIEPDDDPDSLFAKCVLVGADAYVTAVQAALDGTLVDREQDLSDGRNYRAIERTVAAERRVRRLLRDGLLSRTSAPR